MAACIVCNTQTPPGNLQGVGHMTKLCARLEKVLDEAVPQSSVMCSSCQFDLAQIEMYYALLTVFKKRYSETAKQRFKQNPADETGRNLLHDTAECSSENLQNVFGVTPSLGDADAHLPFRSDAVTKGSPADIPTAAGAPIVKEEYPVDASSPPAETSANNAENIGDTRRGNPHPIAFSNSSPVAAPKKRGRPRKNIPSPAAAAVPKKRGRPRKNDQASTERSAVKKPRSAKKKVPHASVAAPRSAVSAKKRGRPKKSESADNSQAVDSTGSETEDLDLEEPERQAPGSEGEAETTELVRVKVEVAEPDDASVLSGETGADDAATPVSKKKPRKPRLDQDPSYDAVKQKSAGRRKRTRPKSDKPQPPFTCPVCNKVFDDKYKFKVHMNTHSDERPFVCSECGKGFKDSNYLRGHMRIHTAEKTFICDMCGKAFLLKKTMEKHKLVHTDVRPYPCEQCPQRFKSADRLKYHFQLAHVQGRKFLCSICGMALYTANTLRIHMTSHSAVKPFHCPTCGNGYMTKQALLTHQTSHSEAGRIKHLCPICGKSFSNKSYLAPHMRLHTGESTHVCGICNKSCITGHAYRRHLLIHQDSKPHQCKQCGKGFRVLSNLTQHMISHSEERPWVCDCGKTFNRKYKLQRHMSTKIHAEYEAKTVPKRENRPLAPPKRENQPLVAPSDSRVIPDPALPMDFPVPIVIMPPQPIAGPVPVEGPVSVEEPMSLVIETQRQQLYAMADEAAPAYLALSNQEVIVEHVE